MQNQPKKYAPLWMFLSIGLLNSITITSLMMIIMNHHNTELIMDYYIPFTMFIVYSSLVFLISYNKTDAGKLLTVISITSFILCVCIYFNIVHVNVDLIVLRIILLTLFGFVGLFLIQSYHQCAYKKPSYIVFFENVWTTLPLLIVTSLFVGLILFLINTMVGMLYLFQLKSFAKLILENPFFYTFVYPLAFAVGLYICLSNIKILSNLRFICLAFFKAAFPILWAFLLLFFCLLVSSLIVNNKGVFQGSNLSIFCFYLTVLGIVFINAVFQDNGDQCKKLYRFLINSFILCMPILMIVGIVKYSETLTKQFYNQTDIGIYILAIFLLAYSIGYIIKIFSKQQWLSSLKPTNFYLAWAVMVITIIVNINPLMDLLPRPKQSPNTFNPNHHYTYPVLSNKVCPKLINLKSNVQQPNKWAEAGLISNNTMAPRVCPKACRCAGHWNGQWRTLDHYKSTYSVMSVCQCLIK